MAVFALSSLLSCVPNNDDDDDSSANTNTETLKSAMTKWYMAQCAFDERCLATNGPRFTTRAACEADAQTVYDSMPDLFEAIFQLGDASKMGECVSTLTARPCLGADPEPEACQAVLVLKDAAGVGGTCYDSATATYSICAYGAECQTVAGSSCQTCVAQLAQGQTCVADGSYSGGCLDGLYCNATTLTCQARVGLGAPCTSGGGECGGNLWCAGPTGAKTCQAAKSEGQTCGADGVVCLEGLDCPTDNEVRTCVAQLANGQACSRASNGRQCQQACVFATPSSTMGTCQNLTQSPPAGQPCALVDGSYSCAYPAAYPSAQEDSCECRARHATGACTESDECTGYCDGLEVSATGTCAAFGGAGAPCVSGYECLSFVCDTGASPAVCTAPEACL
jgi:hypothetical protein